MQDTKVQERTLENSKKGTERGHTNSLSPGAVVRRLPKTHQDYWFARLRKRAYTDRSGRATEIANWQVRLKQDGREAWFNLGTPNQAAAAKAAKRIFIFLQANGWEKTLAQFKRDSSAAPRLNLTVGEFLRAVKAAGQLRPRTFLNYQNCFRTIISQVFGIKGDDTKYDYRQGGNQKWTERIDRIRLERVTPARIGQWKQRRIKAAGHSHTAIAAAQRTCNSYIRCARSLFRSKLTGQLKGIILPNPLPFAGVGLFPSGSMKYVSKMDAPALIAAAKTELKPAEPEVYKAFLLGLFAGMRRSEIDLAEWRMVDWQNHVINLEQTQWLHLKTEGSEGKITIDAEMSAELRAFMPGSQSPFIIASERLPRNDSARPYYRCQPVFDRLNQWLRAKGVTANKPLHELRKEVGALIATKDGIYAASRFLRHTDITTTARHYADQKARISTGLGRLLDTQIRPVPTANPAAKASA